ncbi:hypothetical protein [Oceaniradius stylonematis]|uniref:hypothetical protein n=1 Tax=Oceaniradius stylonematis TaxID=2184161 RepID=UPI00273F58C4|nr:hypothetical protein [Oceaniradius stylonematis]
MPSRTLRKIAAMTVSSMLLAWPANATDDALTLALEETGQREYYCTTTFALTKPDSVAYQEVNGFFYVFVGDEQVGRSKGASFGFADGETSASATFETPNAPCADVDSYVFVVGACMQNGSFTDRNACAATIAPGGVVKEVRAR